MSHNHGRIWLAVFSLVVTSWVHAESVQVVAEKVNLRSQPNRAGTIAVTPSQGVVLDVVEKADTCLRVKVRETVNEGHMHDALVGTAALSRDPMSAAPPSARAAMPSEQTMASSSQGRQSSLPRQERDFRVNAFFGFANMLDTTVIGFGGGVGVFPFSNRAVEFAGELAYGRKDGIGFTMITGSALYNFELTDSRIRPYAGGGIAHVRGLGGSDTGFQFGGGIRTPINESVDFRADVLIALLGFTTTRITGGISF